MAATHTGHRVGQLVVEPKIQAMVIVTSGDRQGTVRTSGIVAHATRLYVQPGRNVVNIERDEVLRLPFCDE